MMAEALLGTAQHTDEIQYVENEGTGQDVLLKELEMCAMEASGRFMEGLGKFMPLSAQ